MLVHHIETNKCPRPSKPRSTVNRYGFPLRYLSFTQLNKLDNSLIRRVRPIRVLHIIALNATPLKLIVFVHLLVESDHTSHIGVVEQLYEKSRF